MISNWPILLISFFIIISDGVMSVFNSSEMSLEISLGLIIA